LSFVNNFLFSFLLGCFEWRKSYWGMLDTNVLYHSKQKFDYWFTTLWESTIVC